MNAGYRAAAALLAMLGVALALPAAQPKPSRKEAELRAITEDIRRTERQVQQDGVRRTQLRRELKDAELLVVKAQGELTRLRAERAERSAIRRHLEAEMAQREAERERTAAQLAAQLRAAYFMGRNEPLKLLLNQRSPAEFSRNLAYYGYLGRLRADQMDKLAANIARIGDLTAEIEAEDARLASLEQQQKVRITDREKAREGRGQVLASLERDSGNRTARLTELRQERAQLEREIERLRRQTESSPYDPKAAFARNRGRLSWPVAGRIIENYGATISSTERADGVDIDTEAGAPVRTIHEGRVIFFDWLGQRGQAVIIDHGNGYWSVYGHLGEVYVRAGELVASGHMIGKAGDTGGRHRSGLFFQLRYGAKKQGEKPIDPRPWFGTAAPAPR